MPRPAALQVVLTFEKCGELGCQLVQRQAAADGTQLFSRYLLSGHDLSCVAERRRIVTTQSSHVNARIPFPRRVLPIRAKISQKIQNQPSTACLQLIAANKNATHSKRRPALGLRYISISWTATNHKNGLRAIVASSLDRH